MPLGVMWPDGANCSALYHLENANDSSGNSRTLTNSGASFATGIMNVGANLGTSGTYYLYRSTDDVIDTSTDLTFLGWINFTTLPASGSTVYIAHLANSTNPVHDLYLANSSGTYTLYYRVNTTVVSAVITITTGKKHCVGFSYTASGTVQHLYYDGGMLV